MPYVNHRWLGGLLTNFQTISERSGPSTTWSATKQRDRLACCRRVSGWAAEADLVKLRAKPRRRSRT